MSNLVLDNDASSSFNSTSLMLAKPGPLSFDLSELLSAKTPYTPSSLSTYDSSSIKAEEDIFRPIISGETITSSKAFNELAALEQVPKRITLGDFVTKRPYNRRPKNIDGVPDSKKEPTKRRKRVANIEKAGNDIIVKKEKLQNGVSREIAVVSDDQHMFPEIVFKDGKIQVAESTSQVVEKVQRGLEIVQVAKKKITTSISFKQSNHTEKWTELENEKFYRLTKALELFGTEFSMIAKVFKNRNRNQIKNKFLREEKMSAEKVNAALKGSGGVNFHTLLQKFNKLRNSQQNNSDTVEKSGVHNCQSNLLMPILKQEGNRSNNTPETKDSESGGNTETIDSVDRAIMEDLSDIFLTQKSFLNI